MDTTLFTAAKMRELTNVATSDLADVKLAMLFELIHHAAAQGKSYIIVSRLTIWNYRTTLQSLGYTVQEQSPAPGVPSFPDHDPFRISW